MNIITNFIFVILILSISNTSFCNNIFDTEFHHIEIKSINATQTKLEQIKKIKIISFINILDKILTTDNKNYLIKNTQYQKYLDNLVQNIIIENELITNEKYIADIKINFNKKDIIQLLRKNKLNYSDIISKPFLILSSYNEEFITYGLSHNNIFYNIEKLILESENKLLQIKLPNLNPNDRFITSYKNIINDDITSLSKIANKYHINDILIIKIIKINNDLLNIKINYYSNQIQKVLFVSDLNLNDINELHNYIISYLDDWWKNNNLIDNNIINQLICSINSHNYSDLIDIKNKIENLSQFKSIKTIAISYNNNIEKIEFYGDDSIFVKTLLLKNIEINTNDKCTISTKK